MLLPHIRLPLTQQKIQTQAKALELGMQQIQSQRENLANLTLELQDMKKSEEVREEVWCTKCKSKGHSKEQCPLFRNYMTTEAPNPLNGRSSLCCEICKSRGEHHLKIVICCKNMYILQRTYTVSFLDQ